MVKGLYIHIPFCRRICPYCHFIRTVYDEEKENLFIEGFSKEVSWLKEQSFIFDTVYVGGGTPSISKRILSFIFEEIFKNLNFKLQEITVEVNPEDCNLEIFKLFKEYGVSRVSIGIQSGSEKKLKVLSRQHTLLDIKRCLDLVFEFGEFNVNLDFIFGVPHEDRADLLMDFELIESYSPDSLSFYLLEDIRGGYWRNFKRASDDELGERYNFIVNELEKMGFSQYEVSNFSKPGKESLHNLKYWNMREYVGIGPSAVSFFGNKILKNSSSLYIWMKNAKTPLKFLSIEELEAEELFKLILIMGLRLKKGIKEYDVRSITNFSPKEYIAERVPDYERFFNFDGESIALKREYFFLINEILSYL